MKVCSHVSALGTITPTTFGSNPIYIKLNGINEINKNPNNLSLIEA